MSLSLLVTTTTTTLPSSSEQIAAGRQKQELGFLGILAHLRGPGEGGAQGSAFQGFRV